MTLHFFLTTCCFTTPPVLGMIAGKEGGGVGIMIGIGLGLVAGGLAYYALKKTYSYADELELRIESQPKVVKALLQELVGVWLLFLPVAGGLMAFFSTKFIVQQMVG